LALAYARAAVNQLLDSLTATTPHPIVIQRERYVNHTPPQAGDAYLGRPSGRGA
jgi:hypothetical protein